MLEALAGEETVLRDACLRPILAFVNSTIEAEVRRSTPHELDFHDLELNITLQARARPFHAPPLSPDSVLRPFQQARASPVERPAARE